MKETFNIIRKGAPLICFTVGNHCNWQTICTKVKKRVNLFVLIQQRQVLL